MINITPTDKLFKNLKQLPKKASPECVSRHEKIIILKAL